MASGDVDARDRWLEAVNARFGSIDEGFSAIDEIFETSERRIAALEARIVALEAKPALRTVEHQRDSNGEIIRSILLEQQ